MERRAILHLFYAAKENRQLLRECFNLLQAMSRSERLVKYLPHGFSLCVVNHRAEAGGVAERVAMVLVDYITTAKRPTIQDAERYVMDEYEELVSMHPLDNVNVKFKWSVIAKLQVPPYTEKYIFGVYQGSRLLASITELM